MINKVIDRMIKQMDFSWLTKPKKKSVFKDFMNDPDSFILTAYAEGDEIKISLKKRQEDEEA